MSLDQAQLKKNAKRIAEAATRMERQTGVPREFAAAQCCQESGWLERAPGNNPFGIKAHQKIIPALGKPPGVQTIATTEWFTDAQAAKFRQTGKRIVRTLKDGQPIVKNGKAKYAVDDSFAAYDALEHAFLDYANLLQTGTHFKPIWDSFQQHKDKTRYLKEMARVYATDPGYFDALQLLLTPGKRLSQALTDAQSIN